MTALESRSVRVAKPNSTVITDAPETTAASTGSPAATSPPNTNTRMTRVIGSEYSSALPRSCWTASLACWLSAALPPTRTVAPG